MLSSGESLEFFKCLNFKNQLEATWRKFVQQVMTGKTVLNVGEFLFPILRWSNKHTNSPLESLQSKSGQERFMTSQSSRKFSIGSL